MKIRVVILAAGKSARMNGVAKVLLPVGGKPMIVSLLSAVAASGVDPRPVIVVGKNGDEVRAALGDTYDYAVQEEPHGTGDAVRCAEDALRGKTDAVLVLYGDHPFVRPETIRELTKKHLETHATITMATATVPDFEEWRKPLFDFGRIVRKTDGSVEAIVEKKDATPEQLGVREVNPSFFCFSSTWLWENLKKLTSHNAQGEYYLTDLVRIAMDQGEKIVTIEGNPLEIIGVNTPEHLELARKMAD